MVAVEEESNCSLTRVELIIVSSKEMNNTMQILSVSGLVSMSCDQGSSSIYCKSRYDCKDARNSYELFKRGDRVNGTENSQGLGYVGC